MPYGDWYRRFAGAVMRKDHASIAADGGADVFVGDSAMAQRMRGLDWSKTPVGPVAGWPHSLKVVVRILLTSRYAMWLGWGPGFTFFCNDAYRPTLGVKDEWALGAPAGEVWAEIWGDIGPRAESVIQTGQATWDEALLLFLERSGFKEETYHTFSYSPVPDDAGGIGGMLCVVTEDTQRVIGERRLALLREMAADLAATRTPEEVCRAIEERLADGAPDLPFLLVYLFEADGETARLACAAGIVPGAPAAPQVVDVHAPDAPWPAAALLDRSGSGATELTPLAFDDLPSGAWYEPPNRAAVVPIAQQGQERPAGFAVAALNIYRPFDADYRGFVELLVGQIAAGLANASAYESERQRAEALAEIDRAKTTFFSNVSHEFRTPLTLMLGPIEDALGDADEAIGPRTRERLGVAQRNSLRLLRLVNTLLDFARIEADRTRALYEPIDLAALTAELASTFRSATERAGLELRVDCATGGAPTFVDREMWEKIVLNLLSNAFKFTLAGSIEVSLRADADGARLTVRDTGIGIPAHELPHVFDRFHRVENAGGRTHEGTGIGLALVHELVQLHGGTIAVASTIGQGTTFTVTLPAGASHLPPERIGRGRTVASTAAAAQSFVEEALRWLPGGGADEAAFAPGAQAPTGLSTQGARVLLADDNADMRDYVARLLGAYWEVETVADGEAALAAARRQRPELVLSDVMMPRLDGFGLLSALRDDPALRAVPIILLSARAGEESRVGGLDAGADDYLVKPFSARELIARVHSHIELARSRSAAARRIEESEQRLRVATAAAKLGVFQWEVATDVAETDDQGYAILGRTPADGPLSRRLLVDAILHPDDVAVLEAALAQGMQPGRSFHVACRIRRHDDGAERWLEMWGQFTFSADGVPLRMIGVAADVTDHRRAELALRSNEHRLRRIVESNMIGVVFWSEDGAVLDANDAFLAMAGRTREDLRAQRLDWRTLVAADRLPAHQSALQEIRASGTSVAIESALLRPDGSRLPILCAGTSINAEPLEGVTWVIDISAQKRGEAEREALLQVADSARAEAEAASRAKDQFLAMLGHELRNPLSAVRNAVVAAQSSEVLRERALEIAGRQTDQLARLIDDLLDVARITHGRIALRRERVDLAAITTRAAEAVRAVIEERRHRLAIHVAAEAIELDADAARLEQVIVNLLTNAAKYTEAGGDIVLSASREGDDAVIRVADNGIGMAADMLPRVFDLFAQADHSLDRADGGLGIGLTLVKRIVEFHGGAVEARSRGLGRGSEFIVRLPALPPRTATTAAGPPPRVVASPVSLIVVEDNVDAAESLVMLLELFGHNVRAFHDGAAALDGACAEPPDVMLVDIGLPGMDGYEVARRARREPRLRRVSLVALTGYGRDEDRQAAIAAGFDHHLVKPIEPSALQSLMATLARAASPDRPGAS